MSGGITNTTFEVIKEEPEGSKDVLWPGGAGKEKRSGLLLSPIYRRGSGSHVKVKFSCFHDLADQAAPHV